MTFDEVEKHIDLSYEKRVPQALNEMIWCRPLALYLNKKYSKNYNDVYKNELLDKRGVDIVLSEKKENGDITEKIFIQLTHAKEYDMSPNFVNDNEVNLTGKPILDAVSYKCDHYFKRGIDTHKIVLLIQGVLPESYVNELFEDGNYISNFTKIDCFDGIYYISDKVYPLKEIDFNN
jgi:hypothetical protein